MSNTLRPCFWLILLALPLAAMAQLAPGHVAIVAYNTGGNDEFAWVALRAIPANTPLNFTDSSFSNQWARWTEHLGRVVAPGPLSWTCPTTLPRGTVVTWNADGREVWSEGEHSGGRPTLSREGDQLIVYTGIITNNPALPAPWQGDCSGAMLLFGLNFANKGWDNVDGGDTSTSFIPPGLSTNLGTAVHVNSRANGYYSGSRTGTVSQLLAALASPANWTTSNDWIAPSHWPASFTVIPETSGSVFRIR